MKRKILFISILLVLVFSLTALSLSLNEWLDMTEGSFKPKIVSVRIALNIVSITFNACLILFMLALPFLRKKELKNRIKLVFNIVIAVMSIFITAILLMNSLNWVAEGYAFSEIILTNSFSVVLMLEISLYECYVVLNTTKTIL